MKMRITNNCDACGKSIVLGEMVSKVELVTDSEQKLLASMMVHSSRARGCLRELKEKYIGEESLSAET